MIVLGIESTAHTFGVGIIDSKKKKVLFNEKVQFNEEEGMDLRKLTEFHVSNFDSVLKSAKQFLSYQLNMNFKDLDLISFSRGPGIGNSLKVGALVAKTLAKKYDLPIVGVNHIKAHLEIGKMYTGLKDPLFVYVSGVNSQIITKDENGKYKIYGETEDIGVGNLLDSFARIANIDFPGGPVIEKKAKEAENYLELPYTVKGMNISLAGLYSHLKRSIDTCSVKDLNQRKYFKYEDRDKLINDLSYSLQETVFAMLMEVAERAMAYTKKSELVIVGGVGANARLNEMAKKMCDDRGAKFKSFPLDLALDNGAMIAWEGYIQNKKAKKSIDNLEPLPYINVESEE